jgi:NTP pyrophosphatase (non-canonical NTP hydrolase)
MNFETFINENVIPENWKVLSARFDTSQWSYTNQRLKIIGEIIEFHEARTRQLNYPSLEAQSLMVEELADVCISCCTLHSLQERKYTMIRIPGSMSELSWINKIVTRQTDAVITSALDYAENAGIDLRTAIEKKIAYNARRIDW